MPRKLCEKIKHFAREPWHRYIVPGYNNEDGFPEYRFAWELFGEAVFYSSTDLFFQPAVFCCFSRAELSDTDLLSLTSELPIASNLAADPILDASESEMKGDEGGYDTDEDIAREMAALNLPLSFGDSRRQGRDYRCCARKYKNYRIRRKSPHHECLSDYLFCNGPYLERKSWFHDYPESFCTTQAAEDFDKYTNLNCVPYALLKEHEEIDTFFGISYSEVNHKSEACSEHWFRGEKNFIKGELEGNSDRGREMENSAEDEEQKHRTDLQEGHSTDDLFKTDCDWDLLYLKHKEAVENRIAKDYNKYKKESNIRRCLEFPDELASVGLIYRKGGSSSEEDDDDDDYLQTGIPGLQRQRGFHIADVHYDFQIPCRFIQKNRIIRPLINEGDIINSFAISAAENISESTNCEFKDFDFGYNAKRDRWLLAINALKTFADDKDMPKYYNQRFRLFSKLNEGIMMDREGWYSVTPERIAAHIADRVVIIKDAVLLDGFAGVGGNCIQFALKGAYVIALDMDPVRLRCAKRNAEIYGVADRINFICIDFFNFCKFHCNKVKQLKMQVREKQNGTLRSLGYDTSKLWKRRRKKKKIANIDRVEKTADSKEFKVVEKTETGKSERTVLVEIDTDDEDDFGIAVDSCNHKPVFDAVLLSPPWGGPSYLKTKLFSLKNMEPKGDRIFRITRKLTHNIAYYLPRQTDAKELIELAKNTGGIVEIEQAEINRKVKAVTAYYGELACEASW